MHCVVLSTLRSKHSDRKGCGCVYAEALSTSCTDRFSSFKAVLSSTLAFLDVLAHGVLYEICHVSSCLRQLHPLFCTSRSNCTFDSSPDEVVYANSSPLPWVPFCLDKLEGYRRRSQDQESCSVSAAVEESVNVRCKCLDVSGRYQMGWLYFLRDAVRTGSRSNNIKVDQCQYRVIAVAPKVQA